jgi:antitoxin (DNA-binding transcriptional repressor) of toxin-antitoxin stability system
MTVISDESAVMYTADMAGPPDVPEEMKIFEVRNKFAAVIDKSRYFGGVTFLMNRGKRVAAIVPTEVGDLAQRLGVDRLLALGANWTRDEADS